MIMNEEFCLLPFSLVSSQTAKGFLYPKPKEEQSEF